MRLALTGILVCALGVAPSASVGLTKASTARVDYGDLSEIAAATTLTFALTVKLTASPTTGEFLIHQFGSTDASAAFLVDVVDTDEVRFLVHSGTGLNYYGWKTQSVNLTNGSTYRIAGRWIVSPASMVIYVNGVQQTLTQTHSSAITSITNVTTPFQIGYNSTRSANCLDGEYSEVALWFGYGVGPSTVPDWVLISYGLGMSPAFWRTPGIYMPLYNTSSLRDRWDGNAGTNSSGTDASHPRMYNPAP